MGKRWFHDEILQHDDEEDKRFERCYWRRVMAFATFLILLITVALTTNANAEPVFKTEQAGAVVILHTDKCALKEVTNLPNKAEWTENGKTFQGCWGVRPDLGLVIAYFDDGAVGLIPFQALQRVSGA